MYSAIKVDGKKLYEIARKGGEVEREARKVTIESIEIHEISEDYCDFTVACSKGTYIRTLCADIGKKLGCGGVMASLERLNAGGALYVVIRKQQGAPSAKNHLQEKFGHVEVIAKEKSYWIIECKKEADA